MVTRGQPPSRTLLADPVRRPDALPALLRSGLLTPGDVLGLARLVGRAVLSPVHRLETAPDTGWHAAFDAAGLTGPLRQQVVEPFLTGTLADAEGTTSRRYVDLLLRSFVAAGVLGSPGLPVGGMQAFSDAVAAPLPAASVRTGNRVESVTPTGDTWTVHGHHGSEGFQVRAGTVVLAGAAGATATLLDRAAPPDRVLTTVWHLSDGPLGLGRRSRYLHVSGDGSHRRPHGLVNTVVVSRSAPDYLPAAPRGARGARGHHGARHAGRRAGGRTRPRSSPGCAPRPRTCSASPPSSSAPRWRSTRSATPCRAARSRCETRRPVDLADGRFVVGDHRDTPSIQGALVSGRRGARAVLDHLGLRPPAAATSSAGHAACPPPPGPTRPGGRPCPLTCPRSSPRPAGGCPATAAASASVR